MRKAKQRGLASLEYYRNKRKGSPERGHSDGEDPPTSPKECVICMERVTVRGVLKKCTHWFCFECIFEWSKVCLWGNIQA